MKKADIIVVGAGAAGLMAAHCLAKAGKKVIVLEARNRIGGRIHTLSDNLFFKGAEMGAEFIHGDLPVTFGLLKEAGIKAYQVSGDMWQFRNGQFTRNESFIADWDELMERLHQLQHDTDIQTFIEKEFPGERYADLRNGVYRFVSGYDTAQPNKASAFALREEWEVEDDNAQYRIEGGYCSVINYLSQSIKQYGGAVLLNSIVKKIVWDDNGAQVTDADVNSYQADKVIIALPLGILQANESETAAINFQPEITKHSQAIQQMGFGAIIKVLLEFDEAFWENKEHTNGADLADMGFLLTEEAVPTWWTQAPLHDKVLTGWLGGMPAAKHRATSEEELIKMALQSLSNIFGFTIDALKDKLVAASAANWTADPFTLGSYAYDTVDAHDARQVLLQPVNDIIYFAGEYLYEGPAMGTVEAALSSGKNVAEKVLG